MLPYADDTPSYSLPFWIIILIVLNLLFFAGSYLAGHDQYIRTIFNYGTIPARFVASADAEFQFDEEMEPLIRGLGVDPDDFAAPLLTLFTAMFLHGGIFHLIGNLWFLWLFGDNVEDRMGKLVFPIFYLICGFVAGLIHVLVNLDSTVPAIGASGAIAGVMGAYIYFFPHGKIATLWGWYWYYSTVHIPAQVFLGIWFVLQLFGGFVQSGGSNVAFWAHIGGFVTGLLLAMFLNAVGAITWYPGDRGYKGEVFRPRATSKITTRTTQRRPRKYVWYD